MSFDWLNAVKNVGEGLVSALVPGGAAIVAGINAILPPDKQLPANATGNQVANAYASLSPADQAAVDQKMLDVQSQEFGAQADAIKAMFASAATAPNDEHAQIAMGAFRIISFVTIVAISMWSYAVALDKDDMIKEIMNGWPFIVGVVGPLVYVLKSYFGAVLVDKASKTAAAVGGTPMTTGIAGAISSVISAFRGK